MKKLQENERTCKLITSKKINLDINLKKCKNITIFQKQFYETKEKLNV